MMYNSILCLQIDHRQGCPKQQWVATHACALLIYVQKRKKKKKGKHKQATFKTDTEYKTL